MTTATWSDIGWLGDDRDAPATVEARAYLEANAGLAGLEILEKSEVERAVRIFRRDGFVVIRDVLTADQTAFLRDGVTQVAREIVAADEQRSGNRGSHRYSFGGSSVTRSMAHRPEWQMLMNVPFIHEIVAEIFESDGYSLRSASGDFCLPGASAYQPLHSDMGDWRSNDSTPFSSFHDPRTMLSTRDLPCPYVCINVLPFDQHALNGPTRQIPGSQHARGPIPTLDEEPEWMRLSTVTPALAGSIQIRDVRAWHGGTPNLSDDLRAIPNVEFYAPWFHEPTLPGISYDDYRTLSEPAQRAARFHVADSSEELPAGYVVKPLPNRSPKPAS